MGRITEEKHDDSLNALVRPGSLDVTGQQTELYPFDAFEFQTYNGKDGNPKVSLKEDWVFDPEAIQAYSLSVKQITAAAETSQINGGTDLTEETTRFYDGGETPTISAHNVYNDNSGENDLEGIPKETIVMESPVFFKEGVSGDVQSLNFESGVQGWEIQKTGDAEFNDGVFRGTIYADDGVFSGIVNADDGIFKGDIISQGFISTGETTGSSQSQFFDNVNGQAKDIYEWYVNTLGWAENTIHRINGTWKGDTVYYTECYKTSSQHYVSYTIKFYDTNANLIDQGLWMYDGNYVSVNKIYERWDAGGYVNGYEYFDADLSTPAPSGNNIKMVNLPTSQPTESGRLWVDTSTNTLKIVT